MLKAKYIMRGMLFVVDKDKLINFLENKKWYQGGIKLPHGLETKSDAIDDCDCDLIFDCMNLTKSDFENKTVLDLGCNTGYYSLKAKELGAASVTAIDLAKDWLDSAIFFSKLKNLVIDFKLSNIEKLEWNNENYDIIFCNSVIYYIKNPIEVLLNIAKCCNEKFVFYSRFWSHHNPDNVGNNFCLGATFVPTLEEMTFILKSLRFKHICINTLKKEWLKDLCYEISLKEKATLPITSRKACLVGVK